MLQEYVATCLGLEMGAYWQISNNFHGYTAIMDKHYSEDMQIISDPYEKFQPFPIMSTTKAAFDSDLNMFINEGPVIGFQDPFFKRVAAPMHTAWFAFKERGAKEAINYAEDIAADDWRKACVEWLERKL